MLKLRKELFFDHIYVWVILLLVSLILVGHQVMIVNPGVPYSIKAEMNHTDETVFANITVEPAGYRVNMSVYALADMRQGASGSKPFYNVTQANVKFEGMSRYPGHVTVQAVDKNGIGSNYEFPYNDSFLPKAQTNASGYNF